MQGDVYLTVMGGVNLALRFLCNITDYIFCVINIKT